MLRFGSSITPNAEAANALELAIRHGHTSGSLRVLRTDPAAPDPGAAWRVDPDRKEILYEDPSLSKGGERPQKG